MSDSAIEAAAADAAGSGVYTLICGEATDVGVLPISTPPGTWPPSSSTFKIGASCTTTAAQVRLFLAPSKTRCLFLTASLQHMAGLKI